LTLVRAIELVVRDVPTARLLLVGSEPDRNYADLLRSEISARGLTQHVSFLGHREDVGSVLQQCDIGVLSSTAEGFPLALIEYGSAGLAAVATDVGQCGEVLDHGGAGHLVPTGAIPELAAAILSLLRSSDLREEFATKLRTRVETLYTPQRVLGEVCQVYNAAVT
jgi:glycosyltransferase involved in cell wall biosynthesis